MGVKKCTVAREWIELLEDGTEWVGLSEHAVDELGDIVFVSLGEEGDVLTAGEAFGDIESVKAVSEINAPVDGVIEEINEVLLDQPELINDNPLETWLVRLSDIGDLSDLMDEDAYFESIGE